ncbi:MAG: 5-oxoprolinase subunit PxpB [Pseudomonadota bacterium]
MTRDPVVRPLGDTALSVEFADRIDPALTARIHAFDAAFTALRLPGVIETVPTYRAITLHLDPLVADRAAIADAVQNLAVAPFDRARDGAVWEVPVVYGGAFGPDLAAVAAHAGLTPDAVIAAHAEPQYQVAMVGFLPGFCYLSGLDAALATPRRADPRARIPASSISIGGAQTAIGSLEGPSGWHVIGRTPVRPFQPGRTPEFLFGPGDTIRMRPIPASEWAALDADAAQGARIATRLTEG